MTAARRAARCRSSIEAPDRCDGEAIECHYRGPAHTVRWADTAVIPLGSPARHRCRAGRWNDLAPQAEPLDERPVAADIGLREVLQQPAATADEQQQAPAAV